MSAGLPEFKPLSDNTRRLLKAATPGASTEPLAGVACEAVAQMTPAEIEQLSLRAFIVIVRGRRHSEEQERQRREERAQRLQRAALSAPSNADEARARRASIRPSAEVIDEFRRRQADEAIAYIERCYERGAPIPDVC